MRSVLLLVLLLTACAAERPDAGLEPVPVPARLDEVDPPVRAQYQETRAGLDTTSGVAAAAGGRRLADLARGDLAAVPDEADPRLIGLASTPTSSPPATRPCSRPTRRTITRLRNVAEQPDGSR